MSEWIKCSERMPESPEHGCLPVIIASYSTERKMWNISYAEFQRNRFHNNFFEILGVDDPYWPITHWQPLPEAPYSVDDQLNTFAKKLIESQEPLGKEFAKVLHENKDDLYD
jgi:hypothetical protein